jgi:hypothetical protein
MKCWNDLQTIPSSVSLMDILGIIKYPYTHMTKVRQLSHAHMVYAKHLPHFNGA